MGVQFQDEQNLPQAYQVGASKPTFADRLVGWGIVGSTEAANKLLLGIAIGAILLAGGVWLFWGGSSGGKDLRQEFPPGSRVL